MSQKILVNNFEPIKDTSEFIQDFMKNYNEESDERYFSEVDVQYLEKLHELHDDLSFLPEWMKIERVEELVANLDDKTEYVIRIRNLKQSLNHRSVLKKVHGIIKFNWNAWLKPYVDRNTDLRNDFEKQKKQNILKKIFLSWWIMQFLEKLWEMLENIEIFNLSQQKEEETIWCQNQIIILQTFSQKIY